MALQNFINKWNGKHCEFAGAPQNQCVDLANEYIVDELKLNPCLYANAVDFWTKADSRFKRIARTPGVIPLPGDVIIWGTWVGAPGHIAVACADADENGFVSFDQNWPTYSVCHYQQHSYAGVIGWLHFDQAMDIKALFTEIWHRPPAYGDYLIFWIRWALKDITSIQEMRDNMTYWYPKVWLTKNIPNPVGNVMWQRNKTNWMKKAAKAKLKLPPKF